MRQRNLTVWLGLLALLLAVLNLPPSASQAVKNLVRETIAPLQESATRALNSLREGWSSVQGLGGLVEENQRLSREVVRLLAQQRENKVLQRENEELRRRQLGTANLLLRQQHLEQENMRLRALLDMRARQPVEGRIAEILYAARDPFSRRVIIDKGIQHGISPGQAVVDDIGVIGQVARVFPLTSEVLLLTDKDQAIPVEVQRNGLRAVLAGAGAGMMELRFLAANAEVQVGDVLVTSGLDGVYLPGLPVAKVVKIDRDSSHSFARITCAPLAGVERHGLALVLGARTALPPQPDDAPAATDQPARGKRVKKKTR